MLKSVVLDIVKTHYKNGHYLLYIPQKYTVKGDFEQTYEKYAGGFVYESNQKINLFETDIPIKIHKPFGKTHRYEYEYYFAFGPHCENYNNDKLVIQCLRNPILNNVELEKVLDNLSIDNNIQIIQLLLLLFVGGFVNDLSCIDKIQHSFPELNISQDHMFEYLMEHLQ
jgi:hypothetical protein